MAELLTLNVKITFGEFIVGERVFSGETTSIIKAVNPSSGTISVEIPLLGSFDIGNPIIGVESGSIGIIINSNTTSVFDLVSLFGNILPKDFSFSEYLLNLPTPQDLAEVFVLSETNPGSTGSSKSASTDDPSPGVVDNPSKAVDPSLTETRTNPANPNAAPGAVTPDDRSNTPVANEPVRDFKAQYPYNKVYRSESGHLMEVDDTPNHERILDQHKSGTYTEMQPDGNFVKKVVTDNYTIVCGDDFVSVEGRAQVVIKGSCQLRVGGNLTVVADGGINMSTKGDFRLKAKSINMESTGGSITTKSAKDTLITSAEKFDVKSKSHHIDSEEMTSLTVGQQFILDAQKISQRSKSDIVIASDAKTSISAKGDTNIVSQGDTFIQSSGATNVKSSGAAAITASSVEIDATLNVKQTTNMKAGAIPVLGQGASAAAAGTAGTPETPVAAELSKVSGITYIPDVERILESTDDDPGQAASAIKHAIETGIISKEELDQPAEQGGEIDKNSPSDANTGARTPVMRTPTITNVGNNPPDNLRLSTHFQLSHLSTHALADHCAVSGPNAEQYVRNLQLLAQNCLEKIKVKFPDVKVTSGYRNYVPPNGSSTSQHLVGQAADLQFSCSPSQYFYIAQWIKDNCPYDQLLLEYKTTGTKLPWIHISYKQNARNQVMTFLNHKRHSDGLVNLRPNG
jgi:Peptidase M15